MSYYMSNEMTTLSPFDEALDRQKQSLLSVEATTTINNEPSNFRPTTSSDDIYSQLTPWLPSFMLRKECNRNSFTPSDVLPFWSTKYRIHKNYYHNNDDDAATEAMIETIDFTVEHVASNVNGSKMEEDYDEEGEHLRVYDSIDSNTKISMTNRYYIDQYHRRQRHVLVSLTGFVVVMIVYLFLFA